MTDTDTWPEFERTPLPTPLEDAREVIRRGPVDSALLLSARGHRIVKGLLEIIDGPAEAPEPDESAPSPPRGRLRVREGTYRTTPGWYVSGTNSKGQRIRVFFEDEAVARRECEAMNVDPDHWTDFSSTPGDGLFAR